MYIVDGQEYRDDETSPDLGSLHCISNSGGKRNYRGLKADFDKLDTIIAKYYDLQSGSLCHFSDTDETYEYLAFDKKWYPVSKGSGGATVVDADGNTYREVTASEVASWWND